MNIFNLIGRYMLLMGKVFSRPERRSVYKRRVLAEMETLGLNSIGIVTLVSVFMGAVLMLQMCINFESPFIPRELMGYATRETMILEFSSTVVALILAGRVGSSIASEIGTMRITEQIDALEIMGVNSASYLILPKSSQRSSSSRCSPSSASSSVSSGDTPSRWSRESSSRTRTSPASKWISDSSPSSMR